MPTSNWDYWGRPAPTGYYASQPTSVSRDDGLTLQDCYITAAVRCAPPANKPLPEETKNCAGYLRQELEILRRIRVVVALGKFAFDSYLRLRPIPGVKFGHGTISRPADSGESDAPGFLSSQPAEHFHGKADHAHADGGFPYGEEVS